MRAMNYPTTTKSFSKADIRVATGLWRAKMPLVTIRNQLNMSEQTLHRTQGFARPFWIFVCCRNRKRTQELDLWP